MEKTMSTNRNQKSAEPARTPFDRAAWIRAATEVLAREGAAGVRVEALAKQCGVTKGSFYWHFKDRDELLHAILAEWKEGRIHDIRKQTEASAETPAERLHHVIEVYATARNRKGMRIELAIRDLAQRDPVAAAIVEETDRVRLQCAQRLFEEAGLPEAEARARSVLLYAYVFGQSLLGFWRHDAEAAEAVKKWIAERITD
jgi:AcrR family transcriptional regulator